MDDDGLSAFITRSENLVKASPQMDEANTKVRIVQPFIELLGWNPQSTEVQLEYSIQMGVGTKKVDYALMLDENPVVFVEVKGCDTTLSESHQNQLKSYMRQLGVNWGVLTNGKRFVFLKRKTGTDRPDEIVLGSAAIEDLEVQSDLLSAIEKESIEQGRDSEIAADIIRIQQAISKLESRKEELADKVVSVVMGELDASLPVSIENEAKGFVDVVLESLRNRGATPSTEQDGKPPEPTGHDFRPGVGENAISGTIDRGSFSGNAADLVAIFPSKPSGVEFLKENNAWGFVRIGRNPRYVAMYVSGDEQAVKYLGEVESIVSAKDAELARPLDSYSESQSDDAQAGFHPDKKVIKFRPRSLHELENPIRFGSKWPQALQYTTLGDLLEAEITDDIL